MDNLYVIQSGGTKVTVSEKGGAVTSFMREGREIFYPLQEVGAKTRGGCFICAPWFGPSFRGEKKHGHLRDIFPYKVAHSDSLIDLKFVRSGDESYPWSLFYSVTILVSADGALWIGLVVEHLSTDGSHGPAPISGGFHPYFSCRRVGQAMVSLEGEKFSGFSDKAKTIPFNGRYRRALIEMPERTVEMKFTKGRGLKEESQLVFWTDLPDRYMCVEPILGEHYLAKGECLSMAAEFKVRTLN